MSRSILLAIINSEEFEKLNKLKYSNGKPIIDNDDQEVLTEIIGMIDKLGFKTTLNFLSIITNRDELIWTQEAMDLGAAAVSREIDIQQTRETGIKGIKKCRFCGSDELIFNQKQTRSGDEPMTVITKCVQCGKFL